MALDPSCSIGTFDGILAGTLRTFSLFLCMEVSRRWRASELEGKSYTSTFLKEGLSQPNVRRCVGPSLIEPFLPNCTRVRPGLIHSFLHAKDNNYPLLFPFPGAQDPRIERLSSGVHLKKCVLLQIILVFFLFFLSSTPPRQIITTSTFVNTLRFGYLNHSSFCRQESRYPFDYQPPHHCFPSESSI